MANKEHINISIDTGLSQKVRALNLNLSAICNDALLKALQEHQTGSSGNVIA